MSRFGRVLITGGAGFFGRTFAKMILDRGLSTEVCIYSRDEYKHFLQRNTIPEHQLASIRWFVGDVRDPQRLLQAMNGVDTVIHAAALKRIEVGQYNPAEMVKTNIVGTMNVLDAATAAGVRRVVFLSTDKAYQPISPYGQSKAIAETLVLNANHTRGRDGPLFAAVRYGNVAGSTGSIIPIWRQLLSPANMLQRNHNGHVPVTDPGCTRFWMTVTEAAEMVVNTVKTMKGGELNIPNLPAYRLDRLAKAMGALGLDIIGLPDHEKKHESMRDGCSSGSARLMTVKELQEAIKHV